MELTEFTRLAVNDARISEEDKLTGRHKERKTVRERGKTERQIDGKTLGQTDIRAKVENRKRSFFLMLRKGGK